MNGDFAAEPVEMPRGVFLIRMSVPCWEEACHECQGCHCACHDKAPHPVHVTTPPRPRRCRACGYLLRSLGHRNRCGEVPARVMRLAETLGGAA